MAICLSSYMMVGVGGSSGAVGVTGSSLQSYIQAYKPE